jgi:hypothetical protein
MAREVSSISRVGTSEPFELQVSRGQIAYHKPLFKFGNNASVGNSLETIWSEGGLYVYPPSASVMTVSSSSTADTSAGTGARTVTVFGLDADYNEISETVTLNGQTAVNTTKSYLRVNRMIVRSAGSGGANAGVIYTGTGTITSGVPANVYASINGVTGSNQSLMALWTVPSGYTAYLLQYDISNGTTSNTPAVCKMILAVRPYGEVFQSKDVKSLTTGMHVEETFSVPVKVAEKSDIEVRAISSSGSVSFDISAAFELIYIENGDVLA